MYKVSIFFLFIFTFTINQGIGQKDLPFKVGTAKAVITPTSEAFIAGHSYNRKFTGVNDDIYVKAFVISNQSDTLALCTFDCIGLLHPQLEIIRNQVKQALPEFPVENIAMTSTHTHSGPDVVGIWGRDVLTTGVDSIYMDDLIQKSVKVIIKAWEASQDVYGEYAETTFGEEWVHNISQPKELDRSVTTLRFSNDKKENVATLVNFACHPTFLDAVNDKVSSDYVWGYYETMSSAQPGEHFFIQGSIGGWVQPEYEEKTAKQAFLRGSELAKVAINSLNTSVTPLSGNELFFTSQKFKVPIDNPSLQQLAQIDVIDRDFGDSTLTEVAYLKIGNASFASHPGETVPELSLRTKDLMNNSGPKFIIGLGMDALGYIVKPEFFDPENNIPHSEYLCSMSLGIEMQALVFEVLENLISQSK